jgi:hypothetical protein
LPEFPKKILATIQPKYKSHFFKVFDIKIHRLQHNQLIANTKHPAKKEDAPRREFNDILLIYCHRKMKQSSLQQAYIHTTKKPHACSARSFPDRALATLFRRQQTARRSLNEKD